jgi:hypothetical protein
MSKLQEFRKHLKEGKVYRRAELAVWSTAVDRHLSMLVKEGVLQKLSPGLYYLPKRTVFGAAPPDEEILVKSFLKDDKFLLTSPNVYNRLGVGTNQLYNKRVVYNHKRHGEFRLGGRTFFFHCRQRFPTRLTQEFLLVDLVNNLKDLAEDQNEVLNKVTVKARTMDPKKLRSAVRSYGNNKAKSLLYPLVNRQQAGIPIAI